MRFFPDDQSSPISLRPKKRFPTNLLLELNLQRYTHAKHKDEINIFIDNDLHTVIVNRIHNKQMLRCFQLFGMKSKKWSRFLYRQSVPSSYFNFFQYCNMFARWNINWKCFNNLQNHTLILLQEYNKNKPTAFGKKNKNKVDEICEVTEWALKLGNTIINKAWNNSIIDHIDKGNTPLKRYIYINVCDIRLDIRIYALIYERKDYWRPRVISILN